MPNWCSNYLTVEGSSDSICKIYEGLQEDNAFEALIGKDPSFAENDWYSHNCSRYGTKWDIGALEPEASVEMTSDTSLSASFDTAWSPPIAFVKHLCKKYKVSATIEYNECGNDFAGRCSFDKTGGTISEEEYEYHEGLYIFDRQAWFDGELEWAMENAHERKLTDEQFVEEYASFMTEEDKQYITKEYQEYREDRQP